MPPFVIATRGSRLALWQAHHVAELLREAHPDQPVEVRTFRTRGDRILDRPLPEIGGKGLFTAELEAALRAGEVSVAVHSLKDLPTDEPEGLGVLAMPPRADGRDALVLHPELPSDGPGDGLLRELPEGAVLGTSSLRRQAQARRLRPDVQVRSIRGNVGTRLGKLDAGEYDAILLACAGLDRLERADRIHRRLDLPWRGAAGQGAVAVQGRVDDAEVGRLLAPIHHRPTALEVRAERGVLAGLDGGCSTPLGVSARVQDGRLQLSAILLRPDGSTSIESEGESEASEDAVQELVGRILDRLRAQGAAELLQD